MDPISIIGTAVALTDISGKIIKLLRNVHVAATSLKNELEQLAKEIENLKTVGETVKGLLDVTESISKEKLSPDTLLNFNKQWVRSLFLVANMTVPLLAHTYVDFVKG